MPVCIISIDPKWETPTLSFFLSSFAHPCLLLLLLLLKIPSKPLIFFRFETLMSDSQNKFMWCMIVKAWNIIWWYIYITRKTLQLLLKAHGSVILISLNSPLSFSLFSLLDIFPNLLILYSSLESFFFSFTSWRNPNFDFTSTVLRSDSNPNLLFFGVNFTHFEVFTSTLSELCIISIFEL